MSQRVLAWLAGKTEWSISRALTGRLARGEPDYLVSLMIAWEVMTPEQRKRWQALVEIARAAKMKRPPGPGSSGA